MKARQIIEDDEDWDPKADAFDAEEQDRVAREQSVQLSFGFYIRTSSEADINVNARERGLALTNDVLDQLIRDIYRIEQNALVILKKWFPANRGPSSEGHTDDSLVGTAWVRTYGPDWDLVKDWDDSTEPFRTGSGTLDQLDPDNQIYAGVSELGQTFLDVDIGFMDLGEIQEFVARG